MTVLEGTELGRYSFKVESGKIREFILAIGDPNPIYVDPTEAKKAGFKDIVAPPTFATAIELWGGQNFEQLCQKLQVNPLRVLHGEQEYQYFQPIYPGDEISFSTKVIGVDQKQGKAGKMNLIQVETQFNNQTGQRVLVARSTIIEKEGGT